MEVEWGRAGRGRDRALLAGSSAADRPARCAAIEAGASVSGAIAGPRAERCRWSGGCRAVSVRCPHCQPRPPAQRSRRPRPLAPRSCRQPLDLLQLPREPCASSGRKASSLHVKELAHDSRRRGVSQASAGVTRPRRTGPSSHRRPINAAAPPGCVHRFFIQVASPGARLPFNQRRPSPNLTARQSRQSAV